MEAFHLGGHQIKRWWSMSHIVMHHSYIQEEWEPLKTMIQRWESWVDSSRRATFSQHHHYPLSFQTFHCGGRNVGRKAAFQYVPLAWEMSKRRTTIWEMFFVIDHQHCHRGGSIHIGNPSYWWIIPRIFLLVWCWMTNCMRRDIQSKMRSFIFMVGSSYLEPPISRIICYKRHMNNSFSTILIPWEPTTLSWRATLGKALKRNYISIWKDAWTTWIWRDT